MMFSRVPGKRWCSLLVVGVLVLAVGCTTTVTSVTHNGESLDPSEVFLENDEAEAEAEAEAIAESDNPILAYLGLDPSPAARSQRDLEVAELTAACMRRHGFEYQPERNEGPAPFSEQRAALVDELGRDAFAEEYGFGYTELMVRSALVDVSSEAELSAIGGVNDETFNALSAAEKAEWSIALYGDGFEYDESGNILDPATGAVLYQFEPGGCTGEGSTSFQTRLDARASLLETEIEDMWNRLDSDPEVIAIWASYTTCMAQNGIESERPSDLEDPLREQSNALRAKLLSESRGGWETVPTDLLQDISDFEQLERQIAVTYIRCSEDLHERYAAINQQYQLELLEEQGIIGGQG